MNYKQNKANKKEHISIIFISNVINDSWHDENVYEINEIQLVILVGFISLPCGLYLYHLNLLYPIKKKCYMSYKNLHS